MSVPAPTVTDACGNVVSSWPALTLNIKPVSNVVSLNDTIIVCSGEVAILDLDPCLVGGNISWDGHSTNGIGDIITDPITQNTSSTFDTIVYSASAELNGCYGDTSLFYIITEPKPIGDFSVNPDPVFILDPVSFTDITISAGDITSWNWFVNGSPFGTDSISNSIFSTPGEYLICLEVSSAEGCADTICKTVTVLPLEIVLPNIISPNGDTQNEYLAFQYLTFFESNHLSIFDRWGKLIYDKESYQNDWNGTGFSDGVYYFVLTAEDKSYSGYFHISR